MKGPRDTIKSLLYESDVHKEQVEALYEHPLSDEEEHSLAEIWTALNFLRSRCHAYLVRGEDDADQ